MSWKLAFAAHPVPAPELGRLQPEEIQHPPDSLVDQVVDRARIIVERRRRRRDDRPHSAQSQHVLEMDVAQRRFARQQDKAAPFLKRHVRGACDEPVGEAEANRRHLHAARRDDHAIVAEGAAGNGRCLIVARMHDRRHGGDLPDAEASLLRDCDLAPSAHNQVALDAKLIKRGKQAHAIDRGFGSSPFDSEGVPTRRTVVVENGVLKSYLLNTYAAKKLGLATTGNASRGLAGTPGIGAGNFFLKPGAKAPRQIIADVKDGLYVTEFLGFGVNLVTGDFSRGAGGLWIVNGELTYPVEEITVAGNLKEMLRNISEIGNDLEFRGSVACPTIRIDGMTVAGE